MIFHRSTQDDSADIEPESVLIMKKWTAVSCSVIAAGNEV